MFEVVNMDFAKRVDIKEAQIAEVAAQIKQLENSLPNASTSEQVRIQAAIVDLRQKELSLQHQLEEYIKRLPLSK